MANRIVAKLEEQPNLPSMRRLYVVGRLAAHPFALPTDDHDMNSSAFNAPWSKVAVVEQATGLIFDRALETDAQTANTYCVGRDPWPASGAVTVISALGIVCLSNHRAFDIRLYFSNRTRRAAQEAAYQFMLAMAGDFAGYEEATRALFADHRAKLERLITEWPPDIRAHVTRLAFDQPERGGT